MLAKSALLLSAASLATASVITDFDTSPVDFAYPPARSGWTADKAATAPCGGAPAGKRTPYPLTGGQVSLAQQDKADGVTILYSKSADPTRFHDFATYPGAATIANLGMGHYCTAGPDFAALGFKAGDDATLLTIYNLDGGEQTYYTCADVNLVDAASFTKPEYVCGNYTGEIDVASADDAVSLTAGEQGSLPAGHAATPNTHVTAPSSTSLAAAATASASAPASAGAHSVGVAGGVVVAAVAAAALL